MHELYQPVAKDGTGRVCWAGPAYAALPDAILVALLAAHRYGLVGAVVRIPISIDPRWPVPRATAAWDAASGRAEPVQ